MEESWSTHLLAVLDDAQLLAGDDAPRLRESAAHFRSADWTVLVSGLCSVGKSSFVCALWGDSELLPTAVRDCTQTNTLIRVPAAGEADRRVLLSYLSRAEAVAFVTKGLSYYRIVEMLNEVLGLTAPRWDELPAETRLRTAVAAVKRIQAEQPKVLVLHEYVTDELEQLEQFLAFIDSPEYRPGETVAAQWDQRRDLLMGRRRADWRTLDVGKLWALRHVELVRQSPGATGLNSETRGTPTIIDSPWIPAFHEARRVDLILEQARRVDILLILALPEKFQPEDWVIRAFRERPELTKRTFVVFNQVDTVDTTALFSRNGFASDFAENAERLRKLGIPPENLYMSCARLPFLAGGPQNPDVAERANHLRKVLARIVKLSSDRAGSDFKTKLLAACDPADCGIVTLRRRLEELARGVILRDRALECLDALEELNLSSDIRQRAAALKTQITME